MKLSKKKTLLSIGLGIVVTVGTVQILPSKTQGEESLNSSDRIIAKAQSESLTQEEIKKKVQTLEERLMTLEPGIYEVGSEIKPGKYQVEPFDQTRDGQIQIFDKDEEQLQSKARWQKLFGSLEEEPEYDYENFQVFDGEVIVLDTKVNMLLLNK